MLLYKLAPKHWSKVLQQLSSEEIKNELKNRRKHKVCDTNNDAARVTWKKETVENQRKIERKRVKKRKREREKK